jgi:hypothetical protein
VTGKRKAAGDRFLRFLQARPLYERHAVLTLDSDFTVYYKDGRKPLAPRGGRDLVEAAAEYNHKAVIAICGKS